MENARTTEEPARKCRKLAKANPDSAHLCLLGGKPIETILPVPGKYYQSAEVQDRKRTQKFVFIGLLQNEIKANRQMGWIDSS